MITLDYRDRRPLYEQVVERFRELMFQGILKENEKMPSVRSLAMELSITPNTIQRAYVELERMGMIYSVKGKGSFVAESNHELIKEEQLKQIEDALGTAIEKARQAGVSMDELKEMLQMLIEEA